MQMTYTKKQLLECKRRIGAQWVVRGYDDTRLDVAGVSSRAFIIRGYKRSGEQDADAAYRSKVISGSSANCWPAFEQHYFRDNDEAKAFVEWLLPAVECFIEARREADRAERAQRDAETKRALEEQDAARARCAAAVQSLEALGVEAMINYDNRTVLLTPDQVTALVAKDNIAIEEAPVRDIGKARRALAEAAQIYASELMHSNTQPPSASMKRLVCAALNYAEAHRELNSFCVPKHKKERE